MRYAKSPADRLAEAQAKVDRLRLNEAKKEVSTNPQLMALNSSLNNVRKDAARISRVMDNFDYRIESNRLHGIFIAAERDYTVAEKEFTASRLDYLNQQIATIAGKIANNETIQDSEISQIIANIPASPDSLQELKDKMDSAHDAWRKNVQANKKKSETAANSLENAANELKAMANPIS